MTRPAPIPPLTSLRFAAALLVVIFHFRIGPNWLAGFGYQAVTFFFVLSGFILTYAHVGARGLDITYKQFLAARIARIFPAYVLALLISLPFFVRAVVKSPHAITESMFATLLVPAMLQAWVPPIALAWNSPAWSLSNELFFYACFPLIFLLPRRVLFVTAPPLVALCGWLQWTLDDPSSSNWHNFSGYFPLLNLPQFLFGIALALAFSAVALSQAAYRAALLAGACLLAAVMALKPLHPLIANSAILVPVFALVIFGAAGIRGPIARVMSFAPFVLLGDASYAIYILHLPIWLWWNHLTMVLFDLRLEPIVGFAIYLSIVVSASILTFRYFESPIRRTVGARLLL